MAVDTIKEALGYDPAPYLAADTVLPPVYDFVCAATLMYGSSRIGASQAREIIEALTNPDFGRGNPSNQNIVNSIASCKTNQPPPAVPAATPSPIIQVPIQQPGATIQSTRVEDPLAQWLPWLFGAGIIAVISGIAWHFSVYKNIPGGKA